MNIVVKEKNKFRLNQFLDWILYMIGYTIVFTLVSFLFKSFYIDTDNYFFYCFIAVIITYLLNKTIKPLLFKLTLPITGVTLGLFYPFLNLFILKLTDWILVDHFNLDNILIAFFIAIVLSVMNLFMEEIVIKPMIRRFKK